MTKESINELREQLGINIGEWKTLYEIDSICLKEGIGIYPNIKFLRFLFTENEILVRHGSSEVYGGRIISKFSISSTMKNINFPHGSVISPFSLHDNFREPQRGDILVARDSNGAILSESLIESVIRGMNGTTINLVNPITLKRDIYLSFYDPVKYEMNSCIHSSIFPGVYLKFKENQEGHTHKLYGKYHEIIKYKNILSFDLKLISKKIYKAK